LNMELTIGSRLPQNCPTYKENNPIISRYKQMQNYLSVLQSTHYLLFLKGVSPLLPDPVQIPLQKYIQDRHLAVIRKILVVYPVTKYHPNLIIFLFLNQNYKNLYHKYRELH